MKDQTIKKHRPAKLGARSIASLAIFALVIALASVVVVQFLSQLALS